MIMVAMPMYQVISAACPHLHAARLEGDESRAEDYESESDGGGRVESQRHGGDGLIPRPPGEAERHPGVDQVAEQHSEGGAREHPRIDDVGRETERQDEDSGQERQHGHIVKHQPEEAIDIAEGEPLVFAIGCHISPLTLLFRNTHRSAPVAKSPGSAQAAVLNHELHEICEMSESALLLCEPVQVDIDLPSLFRFTRDQHKMPPVGGDVIIGEDRDLAGNVIPGYDHARRVRGEIRDSLNSRAQQAFEVSEEQLAPVVSPDGLASLGRGDLV